MRDAIHGKPLGEYVGVDISEGKCVDIVLPSEYDWPESLNESFDLAVSSQTVEHVRHPWKWIVSVAKLVKPGGMVYVCCPSERGFHEYPIDCWRIWPDGMRALMEDAGLKVIEAYNSGVDTTGIARKAG